MADKIRVLYILDPATVGGATQSFLSLVRQMLNKNIEPIVCTSSYDYLNETLKELGVRSIVIGHYEMITNLDSGNGWKSIKRNGKRFLNYIKHDIQALNVIFRNLAKEDIDLIHTNSTRSDVGYWLSMIWHKPHVAHIREFGDLDYDVKPLFPLWKFLYNKYSDCFICVSGAIKKHWMSIGFDSTKMRVIYNGIDNDKITISSNESKNEEILKIVMAGGVFPTKGQHLVVDAIGLLPSNLRSYFHIDFIGHFDENYVNEIKERAVALHVENQITFLGLRKDVLNLYKDYQVGLMCSRNEGFGRVTAEYMFAQLGVIAANSGGSPELIENEKSGLLFESGNARSLANAMARLYLSRNELITFSLNARKRALEMFTAEKYANQIYECYKSILAK